MPEDAAPATASPVASPAATTASTAATAGAHPFDPWITAGFFSFAIVCVLAIAWLAGAKSKLTAPILLTGIMIVVSVLVLSIWKDPMPAGVLPVLASIAGYAFGIVTKKEQ